MNTFCDYYNEGTCRSCDLIELSGDRQLAQKEAMLLEALGPLTNIKLDPSHLSPVLGFRNKVKLVVTGSLDHPVVGLWGESNLDEGREILSCPLHHPVLNRLIGTLPDFIRLALLSPYSIKNKTGELKGIVCYLSQETQEIYLRFILRSEESVTRIKKFMPELLKDPNLKVISANIQPIAHAILEGEKEIILTERSSLRHKMKHVEYHLGTRGFVQTNQTVATALYETAAAWVKERGTNKFLELFCGQGAFSFFCAPFIKEGLGIEINREAVEEANRTKSERGLPQLTFKSSDAGMVKEDVEKFHPDLILVNPPRRGIGEAAAVLLTAKPKYVIYSSCHHESLVRDLEELKGVYQIVRVKLFDMFPHTKHFETLVLLQRL